MKKIEPSPTSSRAQRLLGMAFQRAAKVTSRGRTRVERARSLTLRKVGRASGMLLRHLALAREPYKGGKGTDPVTTALLRARFGRGSVERSLHRLQVAGERIIRLRTEATRAIPRLDDPPLLKETLRKFYGRVASVMEEVEDDLTLLAEAAALLKARPSMEEHLPTIIVVGHPNVGKSSLIRRLTLATPRVAPYPFTTLSIGMGHAKLGPYLKTQVVDTPGLLLRAPKKETPAISAEREALAVLEALNEGTVLFLLDPSGSCGWPLTDQMKLFYRLKERYPERAFLVVENKVDLLRTESAFRKISCLTGEGIEELAHELEEELTAEHPGTGERSLQRGASGEGGLWHRSSPTRSPLR